MEKLPEKLSERRFVAIGREEFVIENINLMCGEIRRYNFLPPHKQLAKITKRSRHEKKGLQHANCLHHVSSFKTFTRFRFIFVFIKTVHGLTCFDLWLCLRAVK